MKIEGTNTLAYFLEREFCNTDHENFWGRNDIAYFGKTSVTNKTSFKAKESVPGTNTPAYSGIVSVTQENTNTLSGQNTQAYSGTSTLEKNITSKLKIY